MPSVVYVLPASSLHGGVRVILEHAAGLVERGYEVTVVGPDPAPDWHPLTFPYRQVSLDEPGAVPKGDVCIGSYWTTIRAAVESGAKTVFHFCQGWEGVHREYAPILPRIDEAYRRPIPKFLVSRHLEPVLRERYGCRIHFLGQAIDSTLFSPGEFRAEPRPLRVGVVGPFGIRPKGIDELLRGIALARRAGHPIEVHHASAEPMRDDERELGETDVYHERLSTRQMVEFYRNVDAYLHPSHDEEGFPLPPLEAMACGVPVAVTRIRSFAVLPDEAVVRFDPGRPESVVPAIARLRDPATRAALREAGLACARGYRLDRVLDRIEAAFAAEGAPVVARP